MFLGFYVTVLKKVLTISGGFSYCVDIEKKKTTEDLKDTERQTRISQ